MKIESVSIFPQATEIEAFILKHREDQEQLLRQREVGQMLHSYDIMFLLI